MAGREPVQLGIADLVRFVPPVDRDTLVDWYAAATLVCVPSYNESFGLVGMEAQAVGTPVVAAAVGGLTTVVRDGVTGLLVDGHDPADYARAIRRLVDEPGLTEMSMFGGRAFLIGGNLAVAASGQGGVLVRVDPETSDRLIGTTAAEPMVMRGRAMRGWLRVASERVRTKRQLVPWVRRGADYARSLPPKRAKSKR